METAEVSSARCKVKAMSGWQRWDFENTGVAVLARKSDLAKALFKSLTLFSPVYSTHSQREQEHLI